MDLTDDECQALLRVLAHASKDDIDDDVRVPLVAKIDVEPLSRMVRESTDSFHEAAFTALVKAVGEARNGITMATQALGAITVLYDEAVPDSDQDVIKDSRSVVLTLNALSGMLGTLLTGLS